MANILSQLSTRCLRCSKHKSLLNLTISATSIQQTRNLSIHEFQSQALLRDAGVPVPKGYLATSVKDVTKAAQDIGPICVLKSQVLAGGRGKGHFDSGLQGGIQVISEGAEKAGEKAQEMLGHHLHTKQTTEKGLPVDKLYVTEKVEYTKEFYLAVTVDRQNCCPAIIVSRAGGTSIEETAKKDPDAVQSVRFDYLGGVTEETVDAVAKVLEVTGSAQREKLAILLRNMIKLFKEKDATLLEINPLVLTAENGDFLCLDAKFNFDDAAKPRQADLFSLEEKKLREGLELEAEESGLVYVRLDGNIGNVVNGAGLAMATNDAISYFGGSSANFLDAGGQATKETMVNAFRIILKDDRVKVILVNIYGGIIRCDMIAESIIAAAKELAPLRVPMVVRLQGTNAEQGQGMMADSNIDGVHAAKGFGEAAQLAVKLAG